MGKSLKKIINEEIERQAKNMKLDSPKEVTSMLKELFAFSTNKVMNQMGSVEADENNQLADENWDFFLETIMESIEEEPNEWYKMIAMTKMKILTYKYFTRQDLIEVESLDSYLRINIKPYFTALQNYQDYKDFRVKFFMLPRDILFSAVRFLFFLEPELDKRIIVTKQELTDNINRIQELRLEVADMIGKASNGYQNVFNMGEVLELYDNGILIEDNFLNRGINEFINKMLSHSTAVGKLRDLFAGASLKSIKKTAETSGAYMAHLESVKTGTGVEYFSPTGDQIGRRFDNELLLVHSGEFDGYVIDKKSRLREPNEKIKPALPVDVMNDVGASDVNDIETDDSDSDFSASSGGSDLSSNSELGNADFGGDFAEEGTEGQVPGDTNGVEADGTPMPSDDEGFPADFGTVEDNTPPEDNSNASKEEKK